MVHSSDNKMALCQEPDYLQVMEMVCVLYPHDLETVYCQQKIAR